MEHRTEDDHDSGRMDGDAGAAGRTFGKGRIGLRFIIKRHASSLSSILRQGKSFGLSGFRPAQQLVVMRDKAAFGLSPSVHVRRETCGHVVA
ncbi:MAG: hypothetical protein BGN91_02690 [Nitrobacter sp. 62-13]|jgi:hypothetical protein|nr:MAG: hypothetical protein BGN91_02690 [Nitrobacter sp. 62-13]